MLCSAGIRKQKGEGQWLPGILIRCRSAKEHQTIKSRVCCNCTPFVSLGMGRDGFGALLKDHTGWLRNPITCWLSIDCLSINKPANMKWPLRPVVGGGGEDNLLKQAGRWIQGWVCSWLLALVKMSHSIVQINAHFISSQPSYYHHEAASFDAF